MANKYDPILGAYRQDDSGSSSTPSTLVTVALANGDYTSIQSAIDSITDATTDKPYVVKVYAGRYIENITLKDWVDLEGVGGQSSIIDGTLTWPSTSNTSSGWSSLNNIGIETTASQNDKIISTEEGNHDIHNCYVYAYGENVSWTQVQVSGGTLASYMSEFEYVAEGQVSGGSTPHMLFEIFGGNVNIEHSETVMTTYDPYQKMFTVDIDGGSGELIKFSWNDTEMHYLGDDPYSGEVVFYECETSAITNEILSNQIHMTTTLSGGGTGVAYELNTNGTSTLHSTSNRIKLANFDLAYMSNVKTNDEIISHFDDIVAPDQSIGAGTYTFVNSPADGILAASVLNGETNAIMTASSAGIIQGSNATITVGPTGGAILNLVEFIIDPTSGELLDGDIYILNNLATSGKLLKFYDGTNKYSVELSKE